MRASVSSPINALDAQNTVKFRQDQAPQITLLSGMGMTYSPYAVKVVKECKLYHKRKVEYMK